jgi:membrane protease YdiL (CAAX protease family)
MSNDSSSTPAEPEPVSWNPWLGLIFVVLVYYVSQILGGAAVSIYPGLQNWSHSQSLEWLNHSVTAQFVYILIAETLAVGAIYLFLKRRGLSLAAIGLKKPRLRDPLYGLAALPAYFLIYLIAIGIISHFIPGLNINQEQHIGFNSVHGTVQLTMTFISLVIVPPLAEEIMIRGFLYSSLRKALKIIPAALIASLIFAAAHLPEGGAAGPLYIAAIDTFVLSLVLVYLREKTGSLWASITLHALKNGIAFVALFIVHAR